MIKIVYVGKDDYVACLRHGDIFCEWTVSSDGSYYIVQNKKGAEIYLQKDEVSLY